MLLVISLFTCRNKVITFVQVLYKGTSKDEKNYTKFRWIKQWWNADVYKHKAECRGLKPCTVPSSYYYSIGIWTHLMYHITHPLHHYCTNKLWQLYEMVCVIFGLPCNLKVTSPSCGGMKWTCRNYMAIIIHSHIPYLRATTILSMCHISLVVCYLHLNIQSRVLVWPLVSCLPVPSAAVWQYLSLRTNESCW